MKSITVILLCLLIISCSDGGSSKATELDGRWSVCYEPDGKLYMKRTVKFNGNVAVIQSVRYVESSCETVQSVESDIDFKFTIGESVTTVGGLEAKELDFVSSENGTFYTIYYINNDVLYFGDTTDFSGSNRPDELDFSWGHIKN